MRFPKITLITLTLVNYHSEIHFQNDGVPKSAKNNYQKHGVSESARLEGSLEFIGDRGYFGHDFHTFKDCLLELYNYNGFFYDKKINLLNSNSYKNDDKNQLDIIEKDITNIYVEGKINDQHYNLLKDSLCKLVKSRN